MKKTIIIAGAAVVLAATPAIIGLWSNPSFSQTIPVRVPASGQVVPLEVAGTPSPSPSIDDNGGDVPRDQRTEPGDDRDVQGATPSPSASPDDHGGDRPRDERTEPGDDRRSGGSDDSGHGSDDDDSSGREPDDDSSGHGSDDSDDDSGHGSDD